MRKIALDKLYSNYEEAAKARTKEIYTAEAIIKKGTKAVEGIYMELGIVSAEDCHNQYVAAYQDCGVATAEQEKRGPRPADGVQAGQ